MTNPDRHRLSQCDCCGERRPRHLMAWIKGYQIETWACEKCRGWDPDDNDYRYQQLQDDRVADRIDGYDRDDLGPSED